MHKNKYTLKGAVRAQRQLWNKNAEALEDILESPTAVSAMLWCLPV